MNDGTLIDRMARRHDVSSDAVRTVLDALQTSGGSMAQFSHGEFGGMAQWSRGGMTMVGDMFNSDMKAKLDALCTDLSTGLPEIPRSEDVPQDDNVSYRSRASAKDLWWPGDLGTPSSVGAQNEMRYAVFPSSRRLAISDGGAVTIYDTADHHISGVAQAQSDDQTLTFTSQDGLVRVNELAKVSR